tara:strand:- start:725 stop:2461 length:1737 start_codon:yes stop_codon:yes gene_type:complete
MSKSIPREFIDKLIEMSDIVGIIGTYVDLRQSSGQYRSKCPFHDGDNITTFSVSPQKGIYHCFKCNEGGNVISFLMKYLSLDFIEAVEKLAEINHVEIPRTAIKQGPDNSKFFEINKLVANEYFTYLRNEPASVKYLKNRGLTGETAKEFLVGFAPKVQTQLIEKLREKFDDELLIKSGSFGKGENGLYPFFRNRITFPIFNTKENVIGFGGRSIDEQMPKYLNSKESNFFQKKRELYGFNKARQDKELDYFLVTEGYMDVIMLNQNGINNAVASLGTAFSLYHLENLFKFKNKIVFCFDSDEAGLKAAWRSLNQCINKIYADRTIRFLFLPAGEDPDSFVLKNGKEEFLKKAENAFVLENFVFQYLKRGKNLESPEDIRLISYELQNLTKNIEADILKETLMNKISKELGVSKEALVATKKSTPKVNTQLVEQPSKAKTDKSFLLFIYIYSNFKDSITEKGALNFVMHSEEEVLASVKKVIYSIANDNTQHTESALYTEAEMLNLKLSEDDALQEFQRVSDEIQLKYDENFLNEMKKLAKDRKLSFERKENLQKTLNLSDNIPTQEEELIKLLNDYA